MAAPDLLLIKPVSVTPPCITASSGWPSRVSVTLAVSMRDSRCPGMPCIEGVYEAGTVTTDLCKPWLLSAFQCGSEYALPRQAPTCVHSSAEEVLVTFRDLEVNAPVPGVISLALCPAAPEHGAGQKATIEAIPLMVSPNSGGTAEAVAMFDCMKQLVQQQGNMQQQQHHHHGSPRCHPHHHQQPVDCWAAAAGLSLPSSPAAQPLAGLVAPDALSFSAAAHEQLAAAEAAAARVPGACCESCGFGKPEAAAEQALLRATWQQHFLPLLLDMHAALTCAPKPVSCKHHSAATAAAEQLAAAVPGSFAAAARIPNSLEGWGQHAAAAALHSFHSPAAAAAPATASPAAPGQQQQPASFAMLLELAGCTPPPVDVAGQMLMGVVEFLAMHNCWCNVSFLLAKAFKNGLLAATGSLAAQQLQRLHEQQRLQAPVCAAALTAASLVASLAEGAAAAAADDDEEEEEREEGGQLAAAVAQHCHSAGSGDASSSHTRSSCSATAAALERADAPAATPAASSYQRSACAPAGAGRGVVLVVLLLLLIMPSAALFLAAAAQPGGGSMLCTASPLVGANACVISSSSVLDGLLLNGCGAAAVQVGLYAAVMSLVLFVMVAATHGRNALHKQGLWR
uniref:Uncharacterized protein n=1 Tax=Tetradesmus obliquus TaxID=3088 RepID=A0A383V4Q3_TETOB|eukprot:jgi/Sobl393_1/283/SZX60071.1